MAGGMQPAPDARCQNAAQHPSRGSSLVRLLGYHRLLVTSGRHAITEALKSRDAQNQMAGHQGVSVNPDCRGSALGGLHPRARLSILQYAAP